MWGVEYQRMKPALTAGLAAGILLLSHTTPAKAQVEIELGAFGGFLAPTSRFQIPVAAGGGFGNLEVKPAGAFTYGGLLRAWFSERLGAQVTLAGSSGDLSITSSIGDTTNHATSSTATAVLLYRLSTPTLPNAVWVGAGAVFRSLESPQFAGLEVTASPGVAFEVGSTIPLGEEQRFKVNLMLDAFIYTVEAVSPDAGSTSGNQFDIRGIAGISYRLGR